MNKIIISESLCISDCQIFYEVEFSLMYQKAVVERELECFIRSEQNFSQEDIEKKILSDMLTVTMTALRAVFYKPLQRLMSSTGLSSANSNQEFYTKSKKPFKS